jgi:uncharacterized protein (TIGR00251 family)
MEGGATVAVRATPRSSRRGIAGAGPEWLAVRLRAPPADGRANEELIEVLAEALDVPKRNVRLLSGAGQRLKRLHVAGLTAAEVRRRLKDTE